MFSIFLTSLENLKVSHGNQASSQYNFKIPKGTNLQKSTIIKETLTS